MTIHERAFEIRKWDRRERRSNHVRRNVFGTSERPRLAVYRSHRHFHAQLIDDTAGRTLASASTEQKAVIEAAFRPDLDQKTKPGASRHAN